MKSNFLIKVNAGNFILLFFVIIICSMTYINSTKYKTMIMKINSENYSSNRDKMNRILKDFKSEISKNKK